MKVRSPLLSLALVFFASINIHAQTTWVGSVDNTFSTLGNWVGGAPTASDLLFSATTKPFINVDTSLAVKSLTFSGVYPAYTFSTANASILSIDSGGINAAAQASSPVDFDSPLSLNLLASQTWMVDGVLRVAGPITNANAATTVLTKTGTGTLVLGGNNTFNGGVLLQQGTLLVSNDSNSAGGTITGGSLGIGPVTIEGNTTFGAIRSGLTIANPISLGSGAVLTSGSGNERERGLTLSGPVTGTSNAMLVNLSSNNPIIFSGSLDALPNTAFQFASTSTEDRDGAVFAGAIGANVVSITADRSALFFANSAALPETLNIQAINSGYVGVIATASLPPVPASALLNRIADPSAFAGTLGFDTEPNSGAPHNYNESLDLRAFTHPSFRIGSATDAILSGAIAPPIVTGTTAYRFGSGGGHLFVQSNLTDAVDPNTSASVSTAVAVSSSPGEDISGIILGGLNTFSGTITVGTVTSNLRIDRAMVVLNSPGALPAGATYSLGDVAYIGYTEAAGFATFADFLSRAASGGYDTNSVFGLDSFGFVQEKMTQGDRQKTEALRVISEAVDLSSLSGGFLGTLTHVRIDGEVRAPSSGILQISGVSEGRLAISSALTPTASDASPNINSVVIGYPGSGDADEFSESEVTLTGASTYTGGTTLQGGTLIVSNNSTLSADTTLISGPVGTGTLTISSADDPVVLASNNLTGATLYNPITLNGPLQLGRDDRSDSSTQPPSFDPHVLILAGNIAGSGGINAAGRSVLSGLNTYSGGTHAETGSLIFASTAAVPTTGSLKSGVNGYIGIASAPDSPQSGFIERFDAANTHGTIGFDSLTSTPAVFSDAISLTNFTSTTTRLGSASIATLTGAITPAGDVYRFGGGGGYLEVASPITGNTSKVEVASPHGASLTLRLSDTNTYLGGTFVHNSAVIFAAGALPTGSPFSIDSNGYIGSDDSSLDADFSSFLGHFAANLDRGTIGFDASPGTTGRTIASTLNLSQFTSSTPNFYIGTSTNLIFGSASSIVLPANATAYRFAGYKGGRLQIDTVLSGPKGLIVGDPNSLMTQTSPAGIVSSVALNAANTFSGGTTLYAGDLLLGTSTDGVGSITSGPLGTGTLTVNPAQFFRGDLRPVLRSLGSQVTLANAIVLNSNLGVGSNLTLDGAISGSGGIYKLDAGTLTLGGNNSSFAGGVFVSEGNVTFAQDTSAGSGMLKLGDLVASTATFTSAAPTIGSLAGDNASDQLFLAANSVLNITQNGSSRFFGEISGPGASINIQGFDPNVGNHLTLGGANLHTGGTTIGSNATVIAAHNNALGTTGGVTLNQGTLAVAQGVTTSFSASHPLTLNGGRLAGTGTFAFTNTSLSVKGGTNGAVTLSPGFQQPGKLNFNFTDATLILDAGGNYHWKLMDASNPAGGWDSIAVSGAVNISADAIAPFNLTIATVNADGSSGAAGNFDVYSSYSWTLLTADSIEGFNPAHFNIDGSLFINGTLDGTFSVSLESNDTSTSLMLNYTAAAIPEPSTWALMIIGVAVIAFSSLRRRSRG